MRTSTARSAASLLPLSLSMMLALGCAASPERRHLSPADGHGARTMEQSWERIAGYSTAFDPGNEERSHNIRLAAEKLDGAVIPPGVRWSFNQHVGPRELTGGWKLAPALDIEGANPSAGGGICQVSSTTYNTLLLADLRVVRRYAHSRPIHYIPLGRDATVSYGHKDLVVHNPHPFPIRVRAHVHHGRLVVEAHAPGRLGYEVRLETADAEPATPRKEFQILENPDRMAVGGVWVKLYRHRVRGGSVYESERIGRASYYPYHIKPPAPREGSEGSEGSEGDR